MIRRTAMRSARWQDPSVTPSVALAVAPGGAIRPIEDPASRRQPYLRLVWSAAPTGQPARASGPIEPAAPHRGAACRLFCPAPRPTSSAPQRRERWVLAFEPTRRQEPDRLIGWIGGSDPLDQVRLEFPSKEAALAYAERYGLVCEVSEPHRRRIVPRSYAENFVVPPKRDARSKFLAAA
jgi:hypothetical protein